MRREPPSSYGRLFWLAYASNTLLIAAVSVLFRYADFVTLLGGTEFHLGWIVGVGTVGSLVMRLWIGSSIDRYGSRVVWIASLTLLVASCLGNLAVTSCTGVSIYALRMAMVCAWTGTFNAGMTFISHQTIPERLAESYAMYGTSSFVGYLAGPPLSDFLLGSGSIDRPHVDQMFIAVSVLAVMALLPAWIATRGDAKRQLPAGGPSAWKLLVRHCPVVVFLIAMPIGLILAIPQAFLAPYVATLKIPRISIFFIVFAVTAIVARILIRRWNQRFGSRWVILWGTAVLVISQLSFLLVKLEWHLALPAMGLGFSQAMLFPTVTAAGSIAFPVSNRGLGTTLILAAFEVGFLIGSPLVGITIKYSERFSLPPYPTMFVATAGVMAAAGVWYAVVTRGESS